MCILLLINSCVTFNFVLIRGLASLFVNSIKNQKNHQQTLFKQVFVDGFIIIVTAKGFKPPTLRAEI